MALRDDYLAALSRAVAGMDRDSYAARGAVYDREHKAMLRRLYSARPPLSDDEIEREKKAFRDAIRRLEFGDEDFQISLIPDREALEEMPVRPPPALAAPPRQAGREQTVGRRSWRRQEPEPEPQPQQQRRPPEIGLWPKQDPAAEARQQPSLGKVHWSRRAPYPELTSQSPEPVRDLDFEAALGQALKIDPPAAEPAREVVESKPSGHTEPVPRKRRSVVGRVLGRTILACLFLGVGLIGYGQLSGEMTVPWLSGLLGQMSPGSSTSLQKVVLFDDDPPDLSGPRTIGQAKWKALSGPPSVQLGVDVPQRKLYMTMSLRPEAVGAMSHLIEIRFLTEDKQPDGDIAGISGIVMTTDGYERRIGLAGSVVTVMPGVFLFGLSSNPVDREKNLRSLRQLTWFGIPLTYRNGAKGVLTVEKGADGQRMLDDLLAQ